MFPSATWMLIVSCAPVGVVSSPRLTTDVDSRGPLPQQARRAWDRVRNVLDLHADAPRVAAPDSRIGLTIGAVHSTGWQGFYWLGAVALAGLLIAFALLIYLRNRITGGQPEKLHSIAKTRFKAESTWWTRIIWRISFVATRSAMPYGIFALSLLNLLPLVVVLAAIGSNTYWISLVLKLRHLLGDEQLAVSS